MIPYDYCLQEYFKNIDDSRLKLSSEPTILNGLQNV